MKWLDFTDVVVVALVIYLPLLIGKYKKSEESLFWASTISLILAVISLFVMGNLKVVHIQSVKPLPILVALVMGFGSYALYKINWNFERHTLSPLTWLVVLPIVDNLALRVFGIRELYWMNQVHQLLIWYVGLNVFLLALVGAFIYLLIFFKNGLFISIWEASIVFVSSLMAGYVYVHYGLVSAILAQASFNLWRLIFAKSAKHKPSF